MHLIEPFYKWMDYYSAAKDEYSPFYERVYSEFEFSNKIYNYVIHPQWDEFGSETLFLKVLYVDYRKGYAIIEFIGEWNDCIENTVSFFYDEVISPLLFHNIKRFVLIGENVLNYHPSDDSYYEEWYSQLFGGWIAGINFREHVVADFQEAGIGQYIHMTDELSNFNWRKYESEQMVLAIDQLMPRMLR